MNDFINIQKNHLQNLGQRTSGDKVIWTTVVLLALVSLLVVYSSTGLRHRPGANTATQCRLTTGGRRRRRRLCAAHFTV